MIPKNILAGAICLVCSSLPSSAQAFSYLTCGGEKVVWDDSFTIVQNAFSIPPGGPREASLDNAINRWRGVGGMMDMVSKSVWMNFGSTYGLDDGQNDAVVVNRSDIGGKSGLASMIHDGCFLAGDMEWLEVDVQVASDMYFGALLETSVVPDRGREVFMHEFGHAHGLQHFQGYNHMRGPGPRPKVGGPGETVDVLPDDAKGGRFLYPSGKTEVNLFASAQRRDIVADTIVNGAPGTVTFCTGGGGTLTINSTVGNNGTVDVTQTERWWLNTSITGHSGGILIGEWNNSTFGANSAFTRLITLTMPPLAAGTYFLFHGVDVFNVANESREDDNNVREALTVKIIPCS
jgi:hypothetical protein